MTSQRVLGRIRLSRDQDTTGTSVERQTEAIGQWAKMHGHTVIGLAVDVDVSGGVDPFDTPELGPWLRPPQLDQWDILAAYRLDRLSRSTIHMNKVFGFCLDHQKSVASCTEGIDISTGVGRLIAYVIAFLAEGELDAIRERNRGSHAAVRAKGRWHGGIPPFGFTTEKREDGHYLIPDPEEVRVIREEILPRVLGHQSTNSIADALNREGVPTRNGKRWSGVTVRTVMRYKALLGQHEHRGRLVVDDSGMPVMRSEPILTTDEFARVQDALAARTVRAGERNQDPLAGVVFCYLCDAILYRNGIRDRPYGYYRCSTRKTATSAACTARSLRTDLVEQVVEDRLLFEIGDVERRERVYVAGSDHGQALDAVRAALETARREKDMGLYEGDDAGYFERVERLTARRRELEALPSSPAGFEWVGLGETYAQAWDRMDAAERRTLLLDSGIKVRVAAGVGNQLFSHVDIPDDIAERIER